MNHSIFSEKYYHMLLLKWNEKIKKILNEDNYNSMEIGNF